MSIWREKEEEYLRKLELSCLQMSREYHDIYFDLKTSQNKYKIPAIIIGSFTGVASFGSSTFPPNYQKWVSISVGLINVAIAILNTLESFFKLGEELSASRSSSEQLKKLAEDINRELALDVSTRQTSGVIFLRDAYTRYQQIVSNAPLLMKYNSYLVLHQKKPSLAKKVSQAIQKTFSNGKDSLSRYVSTTRESMEIDTSNSSPKQHQLKELNEHIIDLKSIELGEIQPEEESLTQSIGLTNNIYTEQQVIAQVNAQVTPQVISNQDLKLYKIRQLSRSTRTL